MRGLSRWLIPVLTCLVVAVSAIAPQQLSALRDRQLSGAVHTEALDGDNNFSVWDPSLTERISLLTDFETGGGSISSVNQTLEGESLRKAEQLALAQLAELVELGIFPSDTVPEQLSYSRGEQLFLWTPENLGGAAFYRLSLEDTGRSWTVSLALDAETGKIIRLEMYMPKLETWQDPPELVGKLFLNWLDVEWDLYGAGRYEALFTLPETDVVYLIAQESSCIIFPYVREEVELKPGAVVPGPEEHYEDVNAYDIQFDEG